jgi:hypothetical protein
VRTVQPEHLAQRRQVAAEEGLVAKMVNQTVYQLGEAETAEILVAAQALMTEQVASVAVELLG